MFEILPLVETKMGRMITNSRAVAETFGRLHKNVLQGIQNLECSEEFRRLNFQPTSNKVPMPRGGFRTEDSFDMTKDGFTFLVMGYTGKLAAQVKEAYIARFNEMEETLRNAHRTAYLGQVVVKEFALNASSTLTMSSREIAELTGKLHKNVVRDIVVMLTGLKSELSDFLGSYIDPTGRKLPLYNLPFRETLILVSGYSVELRARIIDRWMDETLSPNLISVGLTRARVTLRYR